MDIDASMVGTGHHMRRAIYRLDGDYVSTGRGVIFEWNSQRSARVADLDSPTILCSNTES